MQSIGNISHEGALDNSSATDLDLLCHEIREGNVKASHFLFLHFTFTAPICDDLKTRAISLFTENLHAVKVSMDIVDDEGTESFGITWRSIDGQPSCLMFAMSRLAPAYVRHLTNMAVQQAQSRVGYLLQLPPTLFQVDTIVSKNLEFECNMERKMKK